MACLCGNKKIKRNTLHNFNCILTILRTIVFSEQQDSSEEWAAHDAPHNDAPSDPHPDYREWLFNKA